MYGRYKTNTSRSLSPITIGFMRKNGEMSIICVKRHGISLLVKRHVAIRLFFSMRFFCKRTCWPLSLFKREIISCK